jgi:hypothetical protein
MFMIEFLSKNPISVCSRQQRFGHLSPEQAGGMFSFKAYLCERFIYKRFF